MKKILSLIAAAAAAAAALSSTAFAGTWQADSVGRWWRADDGGYPAARWMWIDGNADGTAECYYFDARGYAQAGGITPDGYTVDERGAWTENGAVQTRQAAAAGADVLTPYAGSYENDDLNSFVCTPKADGTFAVDMSIYRLLGTEGTAGLTKDGWLEVTVQDGNGEPIFAVFKPDYGTYTLDVIQSRWDLLPAGETFTGYRKIQ